MESRSWIAAISVWFYNRTKLFCCKAECNRADGPPSLRAPLQSQVCREGLPIRAKGSAAEAKKSIVLSTMTSIAKATTWTASEDRALSAAVSKYGLNAWNTIASLFPSKSAAHCRDRWQGFLDPGLQKGEFTPKEDQRLRDLVQAMGESWAVIGRDLHRAVADCYERWLAMNSRGFEASRPTSAQPAREDKLESRPEVVSMETELKARLTGSLSKKAKKSKRAFLRTMQRHETLNSLVSNEGKSTFGTFAYNQVVRRILRQTISERRIIQKAGARGLRTTAKATPADSGRVAEPLAGDDEKPASDGNESPSDRKPGEPERQSILTPDERAFLRASPEEVVADEAEREDVATRSSAMLEQLVASFLSSNTSEVLCTAQGHAFELNGYGIEFSTDIMDECTGAFIDGRFAESLGKKLTQFQQTFNNLAEITDTIERCK